MKFWAVGGREDRDRMLSLKGSPHLISPICCPDPAEKWLLVLVSTSDPAKIPHASGVRFSNISATGSLPQLYCCSLQQMSFLWSDLGRGRTKEGSEGRSRVFICVQQPPRRSWSGLESCCLAHTSTGMRALFSPSSAFGSAVVCTRVFLEGKICLLPVVLNRTLNSSLKGSKSPEKELSNLPLPF